MILSDERIEEILGSMRNAFGRRQYVDDNEEAALRALILSVQTETAKACAKICDTEFVRWRGDSEDCNAARIAVQNIKSAIRKAGE